MFAYLDEGQGTEHAKIDDPKVEVDAERPLFRRPVDGTESLQELEQSVQKPWILHEPGDEAH